jgi:hypothetical protein
MIGLANSTDSSTIYVRLQFEEEDAPVWHQPPRIQNSVGSFSLRLRLKGLSCDLMNGLFDPDGAIKM